MKAIFIDDRKLKEIDLRDYNKDDHFLMLLNEYNTMESNVIYFSAGVAKIKEIMLSKDPFYSA